MGEGRVIQATTNALHREAPKMDISVRDRFPSNWLLDSMPKEVAESFSVAQLSAIDAVMRKRQSTKQPVDFRFSFPLFRWRFFIVFLLGPERRSPKCRKQDRLKHAVWTIYNWLTLAFLLLFTIPAIIGMIHMISIAMGGS